MAKKAPIPMRAELFFDVQPADLWPLISNTGRLNKSVGLPAVKQTGKKGFLRLGETSLFGMRVTWRELPFEWIAGRFFRSIREFDSGPLERFEGGMSLIPEKGGTRVVIESHFTPRHAVGGLLIRYAAGRKAMADARALVERFARSIKEGGDAFPAHRTKSPPDAAALKRAGELLRRTCAEKEPAGLLLRWIETAYDDELARMRPFDLADRWGKDRLAVLGACLHGVKAGLLDLEWNILCPNCTAANERLGRLSDLKDKAHCESCGIDYGACLDDNVELRFTVNPGIRRAEAHTFCMGNPSQAPFAVAQLLAGTEGPKIHELDLGSESYLARELGCQKKVWLRPSADGPAALSLDFAKLDDGCELKFKPGRVSLTLETCKAAAQIRVERQSWRDGAARASLVASNQEFRTLFSTEVLAPGLEIGVRSVALLFTDLKGSTAMYERIGDATAYSVVRDHFDYLFAIIARRDGAVVKTIGDAVMAGFSRTVDAVAAGIEMQERVGELNKKLEPKPPVVLKIGIHAGPSIVINGNGALDYFGTTVNVAARVQNESAGGDIVVTEGVLCDPAARELVDRGCAKEEAFEIGLKGLTNLFQLRRLTPKPKR